MIRESVLVIVTALLAFVAGWTTAASRYLEPTPMNCTRWAESQPGYGGNAVDNILHRDSLIRECMAR